MADFENCVLVYFDISDNFNKDLAQFFLNG